MTTVVCAGSATAVVPLQLSLAHAIEEVLEELAVAGHEVGHDAPLQGLEPEDEEEDGEDGGLQVAADVAVGPEPGVAQPEGEASRGEGGAEEDEDLERLVHRVDAQDGGRGPLQVLPGGREQAGGTRVPA